MPTLPARIGIVPVAHRYQYPVPRRPFLNPGENILLYPEHQLPQFQPRTYWPVNPGNVPGFRHRVLNARLRNTNWFNVGDLNAVRVSMQNYHGPLLSRFNAMPSFQNSQFFTTSYHGYQWWEHAAVCQKLLKSNMKTTSMGDREMTALLTIMSYGMDHSTMVLEPWSAAVLGSSTQPIEGPYPAYDMNMKQGYVNLARWNVHSLGLQLYKRRWIVVPISFGPSLWIMTLFDRLESQLYIFDCGSTCWRDQRIEAAVHLWVRFWNFMHKPFTFQYFCPATTQQPRVKASGISAVMWAMLNLRNRVGRYMLADDPAVLKKDIIISSPDPHFMLSDSSLPLHDWIPEGCADGRTGLDGVDHILQVVLLNELGLRLPPLTKVFREPPAHQSADYILDKISAAVLRRDSVRSTLFWTDQGAVQFALPQGTRRLSYQENAERFHYRPDPPPRRHSLTDRPDLLRYTPLIHAWSRSVQFTERSPLQRPMPPRVLKVRRRRERDMLNSRNFCVRLLNRCAPDDLHPNNHLPMNLAMRNIRRHRHQNGTVTTRFDLGLYYRQDRVELKVDFPAPLVNSGPHSPDDLWGDDSDQDPDGNDGGFHPEGDSDVGGGGGSNSSSNGGNDGDNESSSVSSGEGDGNRARPRGTAKRQQMDDDEDGNDDATGPRSLKRPRR